MKNNETEPPKEGSNCICLSEIVIDYVFRLAKNYYLQMFLEHSEKEENSE